MNISSPAEFKDVREIVTLKTSMGFSHFFLWFVTGSFFRFHVRHCQAF